MEAAEILTDGGVLAAIGVALGVGALSFLVPETLVMLPAYLSAMSGFALDEMDQKGSERRAVRASAWFVLGFSGAIFTLGGAWPFSEAILRNQLLWSSIGGLVVIAFAVYVIVVALAGDRFAGRLDRSVPVVLVLLGLSFGLVWAPSIGPVLGSILTLAAGLDTAARGRVLLLAFAAGLSFTLMLFALAARRLVRGLGTRSRVVGLVSGGIMLVFGLLMVVNRLHGLSSVAYAILRSVGLDRLTSI